jgi:hypothetical protein
MAATCGWTWFVDVGSADASAGYVAAFRKGLGETGYVEGRNVTVEYHWLEGQFDGLPALMGHGREAATKLCDYTLVLCSEHDVVRLDHFGRTRNRYKIIE